MIGWFLSFLPRRWLQQALAEQWASTLTWGDRVRFEYWGATGNPAHHEFAWADALPKPTEDQTPDATA